MFDQHTFSIICSFLKPNEIHRIRFLNKHTNKWVKEYFLLYYKTTLIQDMVCPKCGGWIDQNDLSKILDFYDLIYRSSLTDIEENYRHLYLNIFFRSSYKRKYIFCEDCESEEIDTHNIKHFFYKGNREYNIHISHNHVSFPWSFIYYKNDSGITCWNEYRLIIPQYSRNY